MTGFVLEEQGDWFEPELPMLRRLVRPGWQVVDVGASYGCYGLSLAATVGASAVTLVEPHPAFGEALARGASAAGGRCKLHRCAVGPAGRGLLSDPKDPEMARLSEDGVHDVEVRPIDELVPDPLAIDLLKVDIEGDLHAALASGSRILAGDRAVVQMPIRLSGQHQGRSCALLMEAGRTLHRVLPGLGVLVPLLPGEGADAFQLNLLAIPAGRRDELRERGLVLGVIDESSPLPEGIKVQMVIDRLAAEPWAKTLCGSWAPNAILPGWDQQRRAVAMQRLAEDAALAVSDRAACLHQALVASRRALAGGMTGSRLVTAVRIMCAAGARVEASRAAEALQAFAQAKDAEIATSFAEPFLPPLREHEAFDAPAIPDLARCMAIEAGLFVPFFSAYFQGATKLPAYERAAALPLHGARSGRVEAILKRMNQRQAPMALRL